MSAPKPAAHIDWVTDDSPAKITDPGAAQKDAGYIGKQSPDPFHFNWILNRIDKWLKYVDCQVDLLAGQGISAIVDPNIAASSAPRFKTLQEAHDDASVVAGSIILIVDDLLLDTTFAWTKADIEIRMLPSKRIKKGPSAPATNFTGIDIQATADRVRLVHLGFGSAAGAEQFSGAGDKALNLSAGADNVLLMNPIFVAGNTQDFEDNSNSTYSTVAPQSGLGQ